jgi:tRNA pseudouridine55 synthase
MIDRFKRDWDFCEEGETLFVDKPLDWTSFDVVKKTKVLFGTRRVGHAGTLDPKATGLLILCTGRRTKMIDSFLSAEKEYTGTFELGVRTPSFDSETEVVERKDWSSVTPDLLERSVAELIGKQHQSPPMYSAVKIEGRPLYRYAREGKTVERTLREIEVYDFRLTGNAGPLVSFSITCSKGTYIRSLVNDLGNRLECGATLRSLRRIRIGEHRVDDAMTIEDLVALRDILRQRHLPEYETSDQA